MPFLDHLEELRWRILWSLAALLVCIVFWFVVFSINASHGILTQFHTQFTVSLEKADESIGRVEQQLAHARPRFRCYGFLPVDPSLEAFHGMAYETAGHDIHDRHYEDPDGDQSSEVKAGSAARGARACIFDLDADHAPLPGSRSTR